MCALTLIIHTNFLRYPDWVAQTSITFKSQLYLKCKVKSQLNLKCKVKSQLNLKCKVKSQLNLKCKVISYTFQVNVSVN